MTDLAAFFVRPEWFADAACRGLDPDLFFPERGQPTGPAKAVCEKCPVRPECLEYALANVEMFGVWGAMSEPERQQIRVRRRPAARRCRYGPCGRTFAPTSRSQLYCEPAHQLAAASERKARKAG